jgi:thymidine phosphorylase
VLEKKIGDRVAAGETLATIHARSAGDAENVTRRVAAAFTVAGQAPPRPLLLRRVTASGIERLDM